MAIEDWAVRSMTAWAAGTVDAPGRDVKAKSGLNRTVLRHGWAMARSMLEYKAAFGCDAGACAAGAHEPDVQRMRPRGRREPQDAGGVRVRGPGGHREDADRNAAKNILSTGHQMMATAHANQPGGSPARPAGCAGCAGCAGYAGYAGNDASRVRGESRGTAGRTQRLEAGWSSRPLAGEPSRD